MSSHRINTAEKDLEEKFIKFLALKSTQVVVQSRLGEKIQTPCNPLASGNDWFNIVIHDHPDVYAETKRALALGPGENILQRLPLCIEISLKTVEGDHMVLEVWSLDLQKNNAQYKDKDDKVDFTKDTGISNKMNSAADSQTLKAAIYSRMGILLKSLISLTRATPAYKLSRRQCKDSYRIYYRIYVDRPQTHNLGEGHKNVCIGQLHTVVGALSMSVAYRTKMTISPTSAPMRTGENNTIILKSNHFPPNDLSPMRQPQLGGLKKGTNGALADRKVIDIDKPLRPGAFTDVGKLRQYTEEDYILPETPPFEWLVRRTRHESTGSGGEGSLESLNRKGGDSPTSSLMCNNGHITSNNNINSTASKNFINNNNNVSTINNNNATFKNYECDEVSQKSNENSILSQSPIKSLLVLNPTTTRHGSTPTLPSQLSDDDNLLKELNFPFASPNSHVNDLAKFYRDCYHAPPLRGLTDIQTEVASCSVMAYAAGSTDNNAVDDLSRQLEQFETSLEDYDKLVAQLGMSASSSTGSRSSGGLQMSN